MYAEQYLWKPARQQRRPIGIDKQVQEDFSITPITPPTGSHLIPLGDDVLGLAKAAMDSILSALKSGFDVGIVPSREELEVFEQTVQRFESSLLSEGVNLEDLSVTVHPYWSLAGEIWAHRMSHRERNV